MGSGIEMITKDQATALIMKAANRSINRNGDLPFDEWKELSHLLWLVETDQYDLAAIDDRIMQGV